MEIQPGEKIKDKVAHLCVAALEPVPTVVDLNPSSASYAVVPVQFQGALGNETLLGWRESSKKKKTPKHLHQTMNERSSKMFCQ